MATRQTSKSLAVVLVHGAFADGSGWESVHGILRRDGYRAVVAQNPTISLAGDVDATKRVIAAQNGRVVLVGHSYGGAVITEAGHEPSVAVLVYIAAYAPDKGESVATLLEDSPPGAPLPPFLQPKDGYLLLDELEFPSAFAADVTAEKAAFMAAAQVPFGLEALNGRVGEPAWKVKPSWYLVATADRMIAPSVQRSMSRRARSTVVEASGSHAIHVSQPIVVAAFIEKAAALFAIGTLTLAAFPSSATADTPKGTTGRKETTMSTSTAVLEATTIQPFRVDVPEEQLADLRRRILATNWPEKETVPDGSQGVQLKTIQQLARYWATDYDWRKCEARLNAVPQFITEIDGLDIHYIHVRSKHKNAMPIIVTHGWPGSIVEQMKIIGPLTDPTAFGGRAEDAFDVVIPSMPGYGYSGRPTTTGWDCPHIARAWVVLMKRLGYTKFVAQGGDWGALVTEQMGLLAPPELLAIHTNMPGVFPNDINNAAFSGAPVPTGLSADEKLAYERLQFVYQKGIGYGYQLGLRPQTMYGIADSPVGLAAYFLDHDARSYELIARVFDGKTEGLTRDDILDNITVTWLTNTALSGARLYWESWGKIGYFNAKGIAIPVAVSVFPDELYPAPRSWAEQAFPNLIYFNKLDKGGHFAAWEQPALFSAEVRAAFRSVRQPGS